MKDFKGTFLPFKNFQFNQVAISIPTTYFENEALQFWKVYFDFAYFCLLTPCKFIWNPHTGYYTRKTNIFQRILRGLMFTVVGSFCLFRVHEMSKRDASANPTLYFEIVYYFFDSVFLIILFIFFTTQIPKLEEIFKELQDNQGIFVIEIQKHKKTRWIARIICILCIWTAALSMLEVLLDKEWRFDEFIHFWERDAASVFNFWYLTDEVPLVFGILSLIADVFVKWYNAFSDVLFTMNALFFYNLVKGLKENVKNSIKSGDMDSLTKVLKQYWWTKEIVWKLNNAMSMVNGAFIIGNLPFYATNIFEIFGNGNIFMRLRYIFYTSYWFTSLFIAANASRMFADEMKEWICKEENYSKIPMIKLNVILHEINYHTVGLGSYGGITVTWNTVGSIISIILTYAVIKSQFKNAGMTIPYDYDMQILKDIQSQIAKLTLS